MARKKGAPERTPPQLQLPLPERQRHFPPSASLNAIRLTAASLRFGNARRICRHQPRQLVAAADPKAAVNIPYMGLQCARRNVEVVANGRIRRLAGQQCGDHRLLPGQPQLAEVRLQFLDRPVHQGHRRARGLPGHPFRSGRLPLRQTEKAHFFQVDDEDETPRQNGEGLKRKQ